MTCSSPSRATDLGRLGLRRSLERCQSQWSQRRRRARFGRTHRVCRILNNDAQRNDSEPIAVAGRMGLIRSASIGSVKFRNEVPAADITTSNASGQIATVAANQTTTGVNFVSRDRSHFLFHQRKRLQRSGRRRHSRSKRIRESPDDASLSTLMATACSTRTRYPRLPQLMAHTRSPM